MGFPDTLWGIFTRRGIFPGANVRVTADGHAHSESALVIDPKNPSRLLGASKRFTGPRHDEFSLVPVFSTDGGATWPAHAPFPMPCFFHARHPQLYQSLGCANS